MKTSNKILLGLLVIIFAVPFLLASSLKSKIKKGDYIVKKFEKGGADQNMYSGSFTAFKVIKVIAPAPEFLTCHLKLSDTMSYKYYQQTNGDSITVFTSNDTLFVKYLERTNISGKPDNRELNKLVIHVNVPAFNNLDVDGAVIILDSLPGSPENLNVNLKNKGVIKDGSQDKSAGNQDVSQQRATGARTVAQTTATNDAPKQSRVVYNKKPVTTPNAGIGVLDVAVKDLLIFHFL